ncbi:acetate kinase [Lachnospiraceae bacterium RM5]|nr:acetate kinase [Lachnospiraceae bacterium RM5]
MKILVINCGSSSLKFQLINSENEDVLAKGLCERIGTKESVINYTPMGSEKKSFDIYMPDHSKAVETVINFLTDENMGVVKSLDEIDAVGHRIVHGGEKFNSSVVIDDEVIKVIEECNDLAPLHNPANIIGIKACKEVMPDTPQCGVFDTAFHQTMPKKSYLYGLPFEYYEKYKVRRYGFHGTSHSYVSKRCADLLNIPYDNSKIIVCHIGNGASICAVKNGESVDTSMGLTPLEGLIMGTRSGSIDPAIIEFIMKKENLTIDEAMNVLNKKSGVYGLAGIGSSDFRDILKAVEEGNKQAADTLEAYCYNVVRYVGAYIAAMNGVDAIVFTAGVGENNPDIRKIVCSYLGYMGIEIDDEKNGMRGEEMVISTDASKVKVLVIPTNEELKIALETKELVSK